jgi:hybrid cluster-associated redox disulfide protein
MSCERGLRAGLRRRVRRLVELQLLGEAATLAGLGEPLRDLERRMEKLEARLDGLHRALAQARAMGRLTPDTTVGRALRIHPGVAAVLAEHGLDRCEGCPVRHDETLAELARGHDLPLGQLLSRLEGLL